MNASNHTAPPQQQPQQHTIIALVQDRPGVLTRVASLFRRRGFNIASLAVGASELKGLSPTHLRRHRRPVHRGTGHPPTWTNWWT